MFVLNFHINNRTRIKFLARLQRFELFLSHRLIVSMKAELFFLIWFWIRFFFSFHHDVPFRATQWRTCVVGYQFNFNLTRLVRFPPFSSEKRSQNINEMRCSVQFWNFWFLWKKRIDSANSQVDDAASPCSWRSSYKVKRLKEEESKRRKNCFSLGRQNVWCVFSAAMCLEFRFVFHSLFALLFFHFPFFSFISPLDLLLASSFNWVGYIYTMKCFKWRQRRSQFKV